MATTVVAGVIRGRQLWLAHAGDSRIYLVRRGTIKQLTEDHSWVAHMMRAGQLSPDEARRHPWRNHITRALGQEGQIEVDSSKMTLEPGDSLLLCTDGLTEYVPDEEIAEIVTNLSGDDAAQRLIDLANERGGHDNISAILVTLTPETQEETLVSQRPKPLTAGRSSHRRAIAIVGCLVLLAAAGALAAGLYLGWFSDLF
jgi:PPM family protein phosphatase